MNKIVICFLVALTALGVSARPGPRFHAPHAPRHHHHHHCGSAALGIGAGILGAGLVANAIYNSTRPQTVVVTQPTVVTPAPVIVQPAPVVTTVPSGHYETRVQNVWVEGRYVDQVGAGGTVIRTWQPGHYEQQSIQVWVQH
jgi:hypothetical protein